MKSVLYLSYNGLLEPILPSQVIPYLRNLSKKGYRFTLLTFEKQKDIKRIGRQGIRAIKTDLMSKGIEWRFLRYHKRPRIFSTMYDLIVGMFHCLYLIPSRNVSLVHVRGVTPGMITIGLSRIFGVKVLFDMRGQLAEEYVGGGIWKDQSMPFKLVKMAEDHLLSSADGIIVLTKKHREFNKSLDYLTGRNVPMDVIPCSVDMDHFHRDEKRSRAFRRELGLDDNFVLMYPGKVGSYYLIDEMLDFYKTMSSVIPRAVFILLTPDEGSLVLQTAKAKGIGTHQLRAVTGIGFDQMPRYLEIADAGIFFISPYKRIGSSPIKMGEFLSSGVPVVINPGIGDTEELVVENRVGVVVPKFTPRDYEQAVRQLCALQEEGNSLRERCREAAGRYLLLGDAVAKYEKMYKMLI